MIDGKGTSADKRGGRVTRKKYRDAGTAVTTSPATTGTTNSALASRTAAADFTEAGATSWRSHTARGTQSTPASVASVASIVGCEIAVIENGSATYTDKGNGMTAPAPSLTAGAKLAAGSAAAATVAGTSDRPTAPAAATADLAEFAPIAIGGIKRQILATVEITHTFRDDAMGSVPTSCAVLARRSIRTRLSAGTAGWTPATAPVAICTRLAGLASISTVPTVATVLSTLSSGGKDFSRAGTRITGLPIHFQVSGESVRTIITDLPFMSGSGIEVAPGEDKIFVAAEKVYAVAGGITGKHLGEVKIADPGGDLDIKS